MDRAYKCMYTKFYAKQDYNKSKKEQGEHWDKKVKGQKNKNVK